MITKSKDIIDETAESLKKDRRVVYIAVKYYFKGLTHLLRNKLSFKEHGLFHMYFKKRRRKTRK